MSGQIFYHFLSSRNAIHDLERKMIRVSHLDDLNDPFELSPYLRFSSEERKRFNDVRKAISKKHGLLCFSESWSEPLLWGHYADKHKGITLGFEISNYEILQVDYVEKRVKLELTNDPQKNEQLFLNILGKNKYKKWDYEKEYRIWVKLENCIIIDGHNFIQFEKNLKVKEIVLGCKYDNSKEYIIKLSRDLGAKVIPSRMAWGEYKVTIDGRQNNRFHIA